MAPPDVRSSEPAPHRRWANPSGEERKSEPDVRGTIERWADEDIAEIEREHAASFATYCPHCFTGDVGIDGDYCDSCGEALDA